MGLINLSGEVALVTGASRGIGAATAKLLAVAGARVAITYRSRKAAAEKVLASLQQHDNTSAIAIQADVSSRDDCERAVAQTVAAFGRLDHFVVNAGIWPPKEIPLAEMTDDQWRTTMSVNLDSIFYGCRAALKAMQGSAVSPTEKSILIVSSTAAQRGEGFHSDYAATKGAVNAFVKSLAVEAAPDIRVNAVAPGWVDTEMCEAPFTRDGGGGKKQIEAGIPIGRVASAADIAGPIVFLCSELARHITGEILNVNGGSVLCG